MNILQAKDLSFSYPEEKTKALNGMNLRIEEGRFYIICGGSGSGKSTLLRHFKTELAPQGKQTGQILYQGKPLGQVPRLTQSKEIGYVFQDPDMQIVTDKVWHELAFGLESIGCKSGEIHLCVAEMASYFGIQNWFEKEVKELSGGQKQLLNLASVMALHPKVLLLDEPTSQLDPIAAENFLDRIHRIHKELGVTVILAEHHLEEVMGWADSVFVMENGKIEAQGSADEIGQCLHQKSHSMFLAMPAPMQIYAAAGGKGTCPYNVVTGRKWLEKELAAKNRQTKSKLDADVQKENMQTECSRNADTQKENIQTECSPNANAQNNRKKRKWHKGEKPIINLRDIWFRYEKDSPDILRGVTLKIWEGEIFALLGGNGTGKSTMLRLLSGALQPDQGNILINGKKITKHSPKEYRQGLLGVVPQDASALFTEKTLEKDLYTISNGKNNITGLKEITSMLHLEPLLKRHPFDLSGGERQRAAFAKVLLLHPKILLLDEPTKGMDAFSKKEFGQILQKLAGKGTTIFLVSHDIAFCAEFATRAGLFFQGNVTGIQKTRAFFSGNHFYTTVANRMARPYFPDAVLISDVVACLSGNPKDRQQNPCIQAQNLTGDAVGKGDVTDQSDAIDKGNAINKDDATDKEEPDTGAKKKGNGSEGIPTDMKSTQRATYLFYRKLHLLSLLLVIPFFIWTGTSLLHGKQYLVASLAVLLYSLLPPLLFLGNGKAKAQKIVTIAVLSALSVAGRAAFFMFPAIKPMAAVAILAGAGLGADTGFLVGALSMLASNMLFGQGPWTPWQMFAMGMVGMPAGLIFYCRKNLQKRRYLCTYGFFSVLLCYGVTMNLASLAMMSYQITMQNIQAILLSGFPMDFIHATSTVLFLALAGKPMLEKLDRINKKMNLAGYGKN